MRPYLNHWPMAVDSTWAKSSGGRNGIIFCAVIIVLGAGLAILSLIGDTNVPMVIVGVLPVISGGALLVGILRARRSSLPLRTDR